MTLDILFLTKNRWEFTREALAALLANTNWDLVRHFLILEDGSTDETRDHLLDATEAFRLRAIRCTKYGSPAAAMNDYVARADPAEIFCKLDNDVIVPPGWLDACFSVMEAHPELDLLGIEPPASRVPHYEGGRRSPTPEYDRQYVCSNRNCYAPCDSIGGIGLMRTRAFLENEPLKPHSTYGGFTEWQLEHPKIRKGWIVPPLDVFLLDRLNFEPWISLSKQYEAKGWQRPWGRYPQSSERLWKWWTPVGEGLGVAAAYGAPPSAPCAGKA